MLMQPLKTLSSLVILICVLITNGYSQAPVKNYEKEWKNVNQLMEKELPKSALIEVKKIYQLAKAEKQPAQIIKTLVFMAGLQSENVVDIDIETIKEFEKEIATSKEPVAAILKSLTAELYQNYYRFRIGYR